MNVTETSLGKRRDLSLENAETSNLTYMADSMELFGHYSCSYSSGVGRNQ